MNSVNPVAARPDGREPLPPIPAKRYFTIGEVSELCGVKPHVLRYWEQEFTQLRPMKRRGNRRYYQHHEVLLVRRIRELLYEQGFTISGARNRLGDAAPVGRRRDAALVDAPEDGLLESPSASVSVPNGVASGHVDRELIESIRADLKAALAVLRGDVAESGDEVSP